MLLVNKAVTYVYIGTLVTCLMLLLFNVLLAIVVESASEIVKENVASPTFWRSFEHYWLTSTSQLDKAARVLKALTYDETLNQECGALRRALVAKSLRAAGVHQGTLFLLVPSTPTKRSALRTSSAAEASRLLVRSTPPLLRNDARQTSARSAHACAIRGFFWVYSGRNSY